MIGIICAMAVEANAIKEMAEEKKTQVISGVEFTNGKIHGKDVVVAVCGIGKVFAAMAAEAMILNYRPELIVNSGVAGSLSPMLGVCDIAIAESLVQHDMNTCAIGDPRGFISGIDMIDLPVCERALKALKKSVENVGIKYVSGRIASGDLFVGSFSQKKKIADSFCAVACEMEGAPIAQVCYVNGVEFAAMRAISDSFSDGSGMEYSEFVEIAAKNSVAVMDNFLKNY